jgi:hypothetical protein
MTFDAERARKADLIQLPQSIEGTNCSNCKHFHKTEQYCDHPKLDMNVDEHWCCYFWGRYDAPLAKPSRSQMSVSPVVKSRMAYILSRFRSRGIVSRFSDCGHTAQGKFDHGNTCASLRGGGKSKSSSSSKSKPNPIHTFLDKQLGNRTDQDSARQIGTDYLLKLAYRASERQKQGDKKAGENYLRDSEHIKQWIADKVVYRESEPDYSKGKLD